MYTHKVNVSFLLSTKCTSLLVNVLHCIKFTSRKNFWNLSKTYCVITLASKNIELLKLIKNLKLDQTHFKPLFKLESKSLTRYLTNIYIYMKTWNIHYNFGWIISCFQIYILRLTTKQVLNHLYKGGFCLN